MPSKGRDTTTEEVLYPDSLPGKGFQVREEATNEGHIWFWDAEEDGAELPDDANFGWFLPVYHPVGTDVERWVSAPRALRDALVDGWDWDEIDAFRVLEVEKGDLEHDPYEIEVEIPYKP